MSYTASFIAGVPMAWTTISPVVRRSAAMAPATELGRDLEETRSVSTLTTYELPATPNAPWGGTGPS
ncbi:hypothetical protein MHTCC0001_37030 [Flavobacteriaceae bacterium MHTCC 0001]